MIVRPLCLTVLPVVSVMLMSAMEAGAQPRVRLTQRDVSTSAPSRSSTTLAQASSSPAPSTTPAPAQAVPIVPTPTYTDSTGSAATTTLPPLTVPSVNFDPYTCPPVEVCPPECPPACPTPGVPYAAPSYTPTSSHRFRIFGDYLYLQPGGGAVTNFALPVSGAIVPLPDNAAPLGPAVAVDPDYTSGFRAGAGWRTSPVGEWVATFTFLQSEADQATSVNPAGIPVLRSLVFHPGTPAANAAFLDATANSSIDIMIGDVDYRGIIANHTGPNQTFNLVLGGRYAQLDQSFGAQFTNVATVEAVDSSVQFQGAGLRIGIDGERRNQRCGFLVYGRGFASFVAGEFSSTFTQTDNLAGVVATTSWDDDRIVPILDLELGLGWKSPRERFLLSAGYAVNAWYNVVTPGRYIGAVQNSSLQDVQDKLIFDGPVARAEIRF